MTTIDELRQPVSDQREIDAHAAAVLRASAFEITQEQWEQAEEEGSIAYGPDVVMVSSTWGIGYVGRLASDGRPFVAFRSVPSPQAWQRRVYGLSEIGQVEYAGVMNSHRWWRRDAARVRRMQRSYRHNGFYRHNAAGRYEDD